MHHAPSQEDEDEGGHGGDTKDKISWSYSSYMAALHREDILNNTDESTFSSLMSDTGNCSSMRIQSNIVLLHDFIEISHQQDKKSY